MDVRHGNLEELELEEKVDAIFSNAVFHWIKDHRNLFSRLRAALAPGGRLIAQCGGRGNVANLAEVMVGVAATDEYGGYLAEVPKAWNFRGAEETAEVLEEVGFTDVRCWLEPKEVRPEEPLAFLRTVSLGPYIAGSAGGAARPVHRRGDGADGRSPCPRLRAPEYRGVRERGVSKHRNLILCAANEAGAIYS